jgi:iron complex outermembrane recepter protein
VRPAANPVGANRGPRAWALRGLPLAAWLAAAAPAAALSAEPMAAPGAQPAAEPRGGSIAKPVPEPGGAPSAAPLTERIVITASGSERRLFDTPYAVGIVEAEQLRGAGPMVNLSEALARVPGLVVANRHNYAQDLQIHSRGFGARASFGVRGIRLYADGIPASGPDGQGQVTHFDLAGAERIEVLRGPFSALFGNSSGGVIALVSAAPTERRAGFGVELGSHGLWQARVGVEAPFDGGFSLRAQASRFEIDGFRPQSAAERRLGNVRLGWEGENDSVVVVLEAIDQPAQDPLGLTREQFEADPDQTAPPALLFDTRKQARQQQAGVSWVHRFEGALADDAALRESRLSAYLGQRSVMQWLSIPVAPQLGPTHPGGVVDFDRGYGGVDGRLVWRWWLAGDRAVQLVAGASAERSVEDRRGWQNFSGSGDERVLGVTGALKREERNRVASRDLYAQAEAELAPRWSASLGLRHGRIDFRSEDHYIAPGNGDDSGALGYRYSNPVAALQWRPEPALALYLSAGRGFESPTFGELAYRPDGEPGFNSALKAQTSRQWELGAKWRPAARALSLDAAVFRIDTDNEIGVASSSGGRTTYRNVGRTARQGAELDLRWRIGAAWRAQAAASWLDARYLRRQRGAGGPPHRRHAAAIRLRRAGLAAGGRHRTRAGGTRPGPRGGERPQQRLRRGLRPAGAARAVAARDRHRPHRAAGARGEPGRTPRGGQRHRQRRQPALLRAGAGARWVAGGAVECGVLSAAAAPAPTRSAAPRRPGSGDSGGAVRLMIAGVVDATCVAWPCRGCRQPAGGGALTPKPVSLQFAEPKRSQFDHDHRPRRRSQDPPLGAAFARRARRGNHHHAPRRAGGPTRGSGCARRCEGGRRRPA